MKVLLVFMIISFGSLCEIRGCNLTLPFYSTIDILLFEPQTGNETLKEKEQEIREISDIQDRKLRNRNVLALILAIALLLIIVIGVLLYRNFQHKLTLRQKKLDRMELESRLLTIEAALNGEERERARVASELHDGLGSLLSGIKFSYQNILPSRDDSKINMEAYSKGMYMLDNALAEVRRIAHNMMPATLIKFGLDTALRDFCSEADQREDLIISYQSIGLEEMELEQSESLAIYRIIQELVHNAIKHAKAKKVIVQLIFSAGKLNITVEDDGIGFNPELTDRSKGIGWNSISNRINLLRGELDLQTSPGKGTSVHISVRI
ncbi:sensor histidine kinase [Muriicola marianensis]|uniref:Histidine kinase domain-containing protein n=1 Tax=Muriicola marianensis TaxID=1324801 RepID=A0ABQ1R1H2_9FLAO|nr:ATP-binding protein [Muriicola marianensis]GGD54682.1 hypothetical protein GCM10011361_21530 [Muriicola marianensis]